MKALSIRQPWAWLIAMAAGYERPQRVENRQWSTEYRGPLLIHAAKTLDLGGAGRTVQRRPDLKGIEDPFTWEPYGMRGGLIGICYLANVAVPKGDEWYDHNSRYGWILEYAYPIPFAPMPGLPGLFDVDTETLPEQTRTAIDLWRAKVEGRH